jgi:hypothetical protein
MAWRDTAKYTEYARAASAGVTSAMALVS